MLVLEERAAHLVQVVGDDDVQAWPGGAVVAYRGDGDAAPCPLRTEFIAGELSRQPAQLCLVAGHAKHEVPAGTVT